MLHIAHEENHVDKERNSEAEQAALSHGHELHGRDEIPATRIGIHLDDGFLQRREHGSEGDIGIVIAAVAGRQEPVRSPLFKRQTERIVRFERAALHAKEGIKVFRVNGVVNRGKLHRAHDAVDAAVNAAHIGDDAHDESLRPGEREEAAERHAQERKADVHALFARLHVEPHLKHVVGDQHEASTQDGDHEPRPTRLGEQTDAVKKRIHFSDPEGLLLGKFRDEVNETLNGADGLRHDEVLAVDDIGRNAWRRRSWASSCQRAAELQASCGRLRILQRWRRSHQDRS